MSAEQLTDLVQSAALLSLAIGLVIDGRRLSRIEKRLSRIEGNWLHRHTRAATEPEKSAKP